MANEKNIPTQNQITYAGKLTGTLDETADLDHLGMSYSPIQATWQVNPGEEVLPEDEDDQTKRID